MPTCSHIPSPRRHLALVGTLTLAAGAASACDSCGCHLPPELGEAQSGLSVGVFEQYTDFSTLKEEGRKVDNPTGQWMHSSTTQAIVGYRFDSVFALNVFAPYISRSFKRPNNGVDETGTVAGLGDMSAVGSARLVHYLDGESAFSGTLLAGIKAPTGDPIQLKSERDGGGDEDDANAVGGHDLALGSGSWDLLVGANAIGRVGHWYAAGQVLYTYHTEGAYQYRMANDLSATGSLGFYLWMEAHDHLGLQVNVIGESKGLDSVAGEKTDDTANHNLFVGPELVALFDRRLSADLALDLPVIENNSAVQLVPTWRVRAGLGWRF